MDRTVMPPGAICAYAPQTPCDDCHGRQGDTETTVDADGTVRQTWRPCGTCAGRGVR